MNPPQVYMWSPSRTLLPPPSPYHPSGPSQCTSPKHPASCIKPGLAPQGASHGGSEKPGKLEVGGASRDPTGFGALEEGLISS